MESKTPLPKIIKLTGKTHWSRYLELNKIASDNGIENFRGHSQLLHLIQGMRVAEEAFDKYKRDMNVWLDNIERECVRNLQLKINAKLENYVK